MSIAADLGPVVGVGYRHRAWLGVAVGHGAPLVGAERVWGVDATVAGGLTLLLATPGAGLTGTAAVRAGLRGDDALLTAGVVVPVAVRLDWPVALVVPVDLETTAGLRLGGVWVGARGSLGGAFVPGQPPSLGSQLSAWVRLTER